MQAFRETKKDLFRAKLMGPISLCLIEQTRGIEGTRQRILHQGRSSGEVALAKIQEARAAFALVDGVVGGMTHQEHAGSLRNVCVVRHIEHHLSQGVLLDPAMKERDESFERLVLPAFSIEFYLNLTCVHF